MKTLLLSPALLLLALPSFAAGFHVSFEFDQRRKDLEAKEADREDDNALKAVEKKLEEVHAKGPTPLFYEQMHASVRHLLISSCGKYPPPLQGI